jgi:hypothetical protein
VFFYLRSLLVWGGYLRRAPVSIEVTTRGDRPGRLTVYLIEWVPCRTSNGLTFRFVFCRMKNSVNMSALLEYMKKDASYRYVVIWCAISLIDS